MSHKRGIYHPWTQSSSNMGLFGVLACPMMQRELLHLIYDNEQVVLFCTCPSLYSAHKADVLDIKYCYLAWLDYQFQEWLADCIRRDIEREAREHHMRQEYRMLTASDSGSESSTDS